ncbi:MAG: protein kinase [Candidatus Sumerlaeaceae bacterium]|nr:protein kinase [Candidatus Sumerlaeaceae bacterium]
MSEPSGPEHKPEITPGEAERLLQAGLGSGPGQPAGAGSAPTADLHLDDAESIAAVAQDFPQLEILGVLGRGGMGVVYKARQVRLDRLVALKVLHEQFSRDPHFIERFTREARALASLSHPNIVVLHDFGQVNDRFYFLMEYVDGSNLRQLIQSHKMKPAEALAIVPKLCDALQYAHDNGIVHRDIKPENVLLDRQGRVKIADFGLVKLLGQTPPGQTLTQTGSVMGTPHYMAPEQLEHPEDVDHRADVYALGVVFYEMLTGELPLGRFQPPSKKVAIDVRLDEVVLTAMEREPERRFQHVSEVRTGIDKITGAQSASGELAGLSLPPGDAVDGKRTSEVFAPGGPVAAASEVAPLAAAKTSWMAVTAAVLSLFGPLLFIGVARALSRGFSQDGSGSEGKMAISFVPLMLFIILPTLLGCSAAGRIRKSGGRLGGLGFALFPALLGVFVLTLYAIPAWDFVYAVAIAMDELSFWGAIGQPAYSRTNANSGVPITLGVITALVLTVWVGRRAWIYCTPWVPRPIRSAGAARGKGPVPVWYAGLIVGAMVICSFLFMKLISREKLQGERAAKGNAALEKADVQKATAQYRMVWRVLGSNGKPMPGVSVGRSNWFDGDLPSGVGSSVDSKYVGTSQTVNLKIVFQGTRGSDDVYAVSMTREIADKGALISKETISDREILFHGRPVTVFDDPMCKVEFVFPTSN